MKSDNAGCCREHEHDWCEVPLHETCFLCAKCGEIRESILVPALGEDGPVGLPAFAEELTAALNF